MSVGVAATCEGLALPLLTLTLCRARFRNDRQVRSTKWFTYWLSHGLD